MEGVSELMPPDCAVSGCRPLMELTPQIAGRGWAESPNPVDSEVITVGSVRLSCSPSAASRLPSPERLIAVEVPPLAPLREVRVGPAVPAGLLEIFVGAGGLSIAVHELAAGLTKVISLPGMALSAVDVADDSDFEAILDAAAIWKAMAPPCKSL